MPSTRYTDQQNPFWDFVAGLGDPDGTRGSRLSRTTVALVGLGPATFHGHGNTGPGVRRLVVDLITEAHHTMEVHLIMKAHLIMEVHLTMVPASIMKDLQVLRVPQALQALKTQSTLLLPPHHTSTLTAVEALTTVDHPTAAATVSVVARSAMDTDMEPSPWLL
ncbi:hypothetical protein LTR60_007219 [Cryomyces antarcticus]|nr:hypothetical protein LTR60_007219 [Cryomyces antarcticus]